MRCASVLLALLLLSFSCQNNGLLFASDSSDGQEQWSEFAYKPYADEEFSRWLVDLRRAESLFIGSLPLSYGIIRLGENLFFEDSEVIGTEGFILRLSAAAGISAVLAAADYLIGRLNSE